MATHPTAVDPAVERHPNLHLALWVVQVLLLAGAGLAGMLKVFMPIAELAELFVWPGDIPAGLVRFIGVVELAGALGVVLPALTGILPRLTPLAAAGLAVVMLLAAGFHLGRGEYAEIGVNLILGGLAAFVVWGRGRKVPIEPRPAGSPLPGR